MANDSIAFENQKIINVDLEREMKKSYIAYSMSVIVGRALPDVRDGLKPVHRRILYTMYEDNLTPDRAFRKSATTVGAVLGRYHPHGDAAVYDSLVRMAQDFSLRYMLVDGHGNFGSVDGDPPAAYRYTEARMAKVAMELLTEIEKETVDFIPNFDNSDEEPTVLPARFPNLLVNGSAGIAVGMATNIPPHNMRETIDAVICVIDNPEADLDDMMEHIKGPDFPTSGIIYGRVGIRAAYATGRGKVKVRARAEIEEDGSKSRIVVTELPYMVNKARLVESIADLVKDKSLEGISALRDESGRNGMKIVIELKRDANAQVVLNKLYSSTSMQTTFAINMLALVDGQPKTLSLREIIDNFVSFQRDIIVRRTRYDLKRAQDRAHILEGLRIAIDNIDEVISIIRSSYDNAKPRLMERFGLSEIQSQAILDMRLGRLQGLERSKIEDEYAALMDKIKYFNEILASDALVMSIVKQELAEIKARFGDERRTEIIESDDEIDIEDLIERQDCVYTMTNMGYIKRQPADVYRSQRRGGRGIAAQTVREEDFIRTLFVASTHDYILFFTSKGRLHRKKGYLVPEAGRTAKGMNIVNLLPLEPDEKVTAMIPVESEEQCKYLFMATRCGTVKRILLSNLNSVRKSGIRAMTLDEGDELIAVRKTDGQQAIIIATREGMAICFDENDVRTTGREAGGVRGIRLNGGDYVVGAARARIGGTLLTVTENGYGKRTPIDDYMRGGASAEDGEAEEGADIAERHVQRRGGKGLVNCKVTEKTGLVADVKVVEETDDVLIISDDGTVIRMSVSEISVYGRNTQGVILMRPGSGSHIISIERTEKVESDDEDTESGQDGQDGQTGAGQETQADAEVSGEPSSATEPDAGQPEQSEQPE